MVKYISCDCKCEFKGATFNSNKKRNNETSLSQIQRRL